MVCIGLVENVSLKQKKIVYHVNSQWNNLSLEEENIWKILPSIYCDFMWIQIR